MMRLTKLWNRDGSGGLGSELSEYERDEGVM
jgi:hypothetical protein